MFRMITLMATAAILGLAVSPPLAAPVAAVAPLDLMQHDPGDKVSVRAVADGAYEWHLPDGLGQQLHLDLGPLGIDPKDYDEFRFEIKPEGSQVSLHTVLQGFPSKKELSSWYMKFKAPAGVWSEGRYDLRVDDDGVFGGNTYAAVGAYGRLQFTLDRRIIGFAGEPAWRKAQIRAPRFIKYRVAATFDILETDIQEGRDEIAYVYSLHLENRTDGAVTAKLDPDATRSLKYFQVAAPAAIALAPRAKATVPIRLFISRQKAMALPPLFAECAFPQVSLDGVPDSDVFPLMGYRKWPMWGAVPIFNRTWWTPATMQAHVAARKALIPGIDGWQAGILKGADATVAVDWPTPPLDLLPAAHIMRYICSTCKCFLQPATPTEFRRHVCPTCKKVYEGDETINKAFVTRYVGDRVENLRNLGLAWLLSGRDDYAKKAVQMLLAYAAAYPKMPVTNMRSTSAGVKLNYATLHSSYLLPVLAEAYAFLHEAPCLDAQSRQSIEGMLNDEAARDMRHSTEYSNQTMEHLRAFGSAGLATGFWPFAAEAIHGEFGWHEMVEYAFSDEGITGEAGAYHRSIFYALSRFAAFACDQNLDLFTARLKRVYDGTLFLVGQDASYELAYRAYRDPTYISALPAAPNEQKILRGVIGVPEPGQMPIASTLMPATGYILLRRGTVADYREIRLNYIKTFDRGEADKFTTFFFHTGKPVDTHVGRIRYFTPGGRMEATAAHNTIVVDGQDEKPTDGQLVAFNAAADAPIGVVGTDPAAPFFDGVQQLRGVALIDKAYVVFDRVTSDKPRNLDRFQYGPGKAVLKFNAATITAPLATPPPIATFKDVEGGPCGREVRVDFGDTLKMRLVADQDLTAYKAVTAGTYEAKPMDVTFARAAAATAVTFLAAFTDEKAAEPPILRIQTSTPQRLVLEVETPAATRVITVDTQAKTATVSVKTR